MASYNNPLANKQLFARPKKNRGGSVRPPVADAPADPAGGARPASAGMTPRPANTAAAQAPAVSPANQNFYKSSQLDPSIRAPAGTVTRGGQIGVYHKGEFRPANEQTIARSIRDQRRKEAWRNEEQYRGDMARSLGVGDISRNQARHLSGADMNMAQAKSWLESDNRVQANKKVLQQQLVSELAAAQGNPEAQQAAQAKYQQGLAEFDSAAGAAPAVSAPAGAGQQYRDPAQGAAVGDAESLAMGPVAAPVDDGDDAFRKFKSERGGWSDIRSGSDRNIREDIARLRERPLTEAEKMGEAQRELMRSEVVAMGRASDTADTLAGVQKQLADTQQAMQETMNRIHLSAESRATTNDMFNRVTTTLENTRKWEHEANKLRAAGDAAGAAKLQTGIDLAMEAYSDFQKGIQEILGNTELSAKDMERMIGVLSKNSATAIARAENILQRGSGAGGVVDPPPGTREEVSPGAGTPGTTPAEAGVAPPVPEEVGVYAAGPETQTEAAPTTATQTEATTTEVAPPVDKPVDKQKEFDAAIDARDDIIAEARRKRLERQGRAKPGEAVTASAPVEPPVKPAAEETAAEAPSGPRTPTPNAEWEKQAQAIRAEGGRSMGKKLAALRKKYDYEKWAFTQTPEDWDREEDAIRERGGRGQGPNMRRLRERRKEWEKFMGVTTRRPKRDVRKLPAKPFSFVTVRNKTGPIQPPVGRTRAYSNR